MKKIISVAILVVLFFILVGCKDNSHELKIPDNHNLDNYDLLEVDIKEHLSKLRFNNDKTRLVSEYYDFSEETYYNDNFIQRIYREKSEYVTYQYQEKVQNISFAGELSSISTSQRNKEKLTKYSYDAVASYDGQTYAVNFKSFNPGPNSEVKKAGKYQTTKGSTIVYNSYLEESIRNYVKQALENNYFDNIKVYKDNNNNYLLRNDSSEDNLIWSLLYDQSYNVISFYNSYFANAEFIRDYGNNEKIKTAEKYEKYIIFDTNLDFRFDYSKYEKIDYPIYH